MPRWLKTTMFVLVTVILTLGPTLFAVALVGLTNQVNDNAKTSYVGTCESGNEVRAETIALVEQLTTNSARNAKAILASPTATPEQRQAAQKNLEAITRTLATTRQELAPKDCTYPPVTPQ